MNFIIITGLIVIFALIIENTYHPRIKNDISGTYIEYSGWLIGSDGERYMKVKRIYLK